MDHRTDEELLALLPTQQDAFSEFYRRHAQRVLAFAARRLGDPEDVADAVAMIFVTVVEAAAGFRPERGRAVAWLDGVAANVIAEQRRASAREARALQRLRGRALIEPDDYADLERAVDAAAADPPADHVRIEHIEQQGGAIMSAGHTPTAKAFLDRLHGELVSELYRDGPIAAADGRPPPVRPSREGWRRARRRRVLLPSLATLVVAGLLAAAAIATSTVTGTAPASAQARVAAAVTRTTQEGYRVRARLSGSKEGWRVNVSDGVFDPASGAVRMVVVTPDKGHVTIHVGDVVYVQIVGRQRGVPPSARWLLRGGGTPKGSGSFKLADFGRVALQNPQQLLGWARSAGDVRELGPVAGDGWSGRRYAFTLTERFSRVTGTVDVDTAGRVHRLEFTSRAWDTAHGVAGTIHGVLEFRDFGTRERVTIPPANQVFDVNIPEPKESRRR